MNSNMANPYFCYAFSFAIAMMTYPLGWSDLYPALTLLLTCFLGVTIIIHLWLGFHFQKSKLIQHKPLLIEATGAPVFITAFLYLLWSCEFLYEGGIPLVMILLDQEFNYILFGIPTLHVFIVTFSSFYTVYLFHLYLSGRQKVIFFLFVINLLAAILIYSRAMFFFNLSACFFLFLFSVKRIPGIVLVITPVLVLLLLFFFGVLGTLRVSRQSSREYSNKLFLSTGGATESFKESVIPKEFFWPYIYITSPLANLQHNIKTHSGHEVTLSNITQMVNNEILMDFLSKRINSLTGSERKTENNILGPFNVSTVYSRAYSYAGWTGMSILAMVILLVPWLYAKLFPARSPFFPTGFAILCTTFLFLAYDNTIRFTGLSFQLVYPVVLHYAALKSKWLRNIFVNNKVTMAQP